MLKVLADVTYELPTLLRETGRWKSLLIDYEPPTVERVYTDLVNGNRLSLHRIHPCEEDGAFFHPHPWPSAVQVFSGRYEMKIGYGSGLEPPPVAMTMILNKGSLYEMVDPDAWHSVRPIGFKSWSMMVNGPAWNRPMPKTPQRILKPLSQERMSEILSSFQNVY